MPDIAVLIVEDEPNLARAASRLLRSMGFEVHSSSGGSEAVELLRVHAEKIKVVLLDAILRDVSSVNTIQALRSVNPEIKVILTSGYPIQECLDGFAGIRLDGFIPKPFGYTELENAIRNSIK